MSERIPHTPETSGATLVKTLDTLFEAAICGAFDEENKRFLKDLGMAVSYGFDQQDADKDALCIANWNSQDIVRIIRAERGVDIAAGLPYPVRFQISQTDMLDRNLHLPFLINGETIWVQRLTFAVSDSGILIPWIRVEADEREVLFFPELEDCTKLHADNMMAWLDLMEARTLVDLYGESDPMSSLQL